MESGKKRRLIYVSTAVAAAVILLLAVLLLQQPIQNKATPPPGSAAPTVATDAASGVTQTAATLNGNLAAMGSASSADVGFLYGTDAGLAGAQNATIKYLGATAPFGTDLSGLTPATTYYVEAWALGDGFSTGSVMSFTTLSNPAPTVHAPSVTTDLASSVTTVSATLNGNLGSLGTASSVTVGFLYGTDPALADATNVTVGTESATGEFHEGILGLTESTTYYVQAWGLGNGFAQGAIVTFTTTSPGNGHHVPPGWAHADCPTLPKQAKAFGEKARCEFNMTWGEMKKLGLTLTAEPQVLIANGPAGAAALRMSDPGNSGVHRSDQSRTW